MYNEPLETLDILHSKVHKGNVFTSNLLLQGVANNGYARLRVITDSNTYLHLNLIQIDAEGKAYFKTYSGTTYSSNGTGLDTNLTQFARNTSRVKKSGVTLYYNPTINVLGTQRGNRLILGGSSPFGNGAILSSNVETVLKPNSEILLEVQNVSGASKDIGIVLDWYEVKGYEL